jgi:hypothetical protein
MTLADEVERYLKMLSGEHDDPAPRECLVCYLARMVETHECDSTLRWAQRFRDRRSPRATGLERRLTDRGWACDCQVLRDGYRLSRHLLVRDLQTDELEAPPEPPLCDGVGHTSTHPCANWERRPRR